MKISILQENLAKALNQVSKAVSNRPNIPVLANVLIVAEKGKVKLSGTNLDIGVNTWLGADIAEEGSLTVSAKLLAEFVNSLSSGKIELIQIKNNLEVKSVDNTAEFNVIPANDFPSVPKSEGNPIVKINALDFAEAVRQTAISTATDDSRPVLTGLLLEATERKISLVGVDGFRLSKKILKVDLGPKEDIKEIVPARSLMELEKIIRDLSDKETMLEIYLLESKNQMIFKVENTEFTTRMIEGEFPNYSQIIPNTKNVSFQVLKEELSNTVKIAGIFARNVIGNKARFKFDPEKKTLELFANVVDVGNNESKVTISKPEGDKLETAYNMKFLQDMINVINGDEILYESEGITSPGVFKDKDDPDFLHIIMPMRLD
ncbi:MAG: polymerase III subunit beta protein [candidate division WS6 bacterium GW2011_GWA2_37_6]|uniref:Beta sliding clamp n=1 Tax=candidate division WS6 bacterium GW2011_GWA2_37_6 TaxID=1619087 RepID=A0A0G0H0X7_9BACT|nr:MAG: polymerase III subunit beta protein [candidate division WS6 bacterium GW2011_GWA2_37_6]